MADRNLVLQLLITAKDQASAVFGKLFRFMDSEISVVAGAVRNAFTGLFGGGLEGAIEFEAQLDKIQAKGGFTAETMRTLKKAAEDIGAQFGVTGTDAARGMESLAAAGLNATEIMQALPVVLNLAKIEALGMDQASALLANSLTTVGLGFEEAARLADVLTQAANESTTSATAIGKALETAGGIARAAGLDLEQTAAALTALAKSGIEGEQAGTGLVAVLTSLIDPASEASKELNKLGITSRDFTTVMEALKSRGEDANAAILAFGREALPSLKSFTDQGKAGLEGLEAAMRGADGAAGRAAGTMSGNLKTALSSLAAAWESLKTALFEPVLEPLAKSATDLSATLNQKLTAGALAPLQEALKALAEGGIRFASEFLGSFDFTAATKNISEFAIGAKDAFTTIGTIGTAAANGIVIAWNAVTAGFSTIGAALTTLTASIVATLANIEEAASKVGLGSVERAAALRTQALAMQTTAADLLNGVIKDAEQLGAAYDRLTADTDKAAAAQEGLKAALPVAELQTLNRTLDDYRGMAERAAAQANQARLEFEAGKISAGDYGAKLLAAAAANQDLADAMAATASASKKETDALKDSTSARQANIESTERIADAASTYTNALQRVANAQLDGLRTEISLANAKGQTATAQRLSRELAELELKWARALTLAKEAEIKAEITSQQAKLTAKQAVQQKTAADQAEINAISAKIAALNLELQLQTQRQGLLIQQQQNLQTSTQITNDNTGAVQQNTEAQQQNTQTAKDAEDAGGGLGEVLAKQIGFWLEHTAALSESTRALFEYNAGLSSIDPQYAQDLTGAVSEGAAEAARKIEALNLGIKGTVNILTTTASSDISRLFGEINIAGAAAERSFYEQKLTAEQLLATLADIGETGRGSFASVEAAMGFLNRTALTTVDSLYLLGDEDLANLRSAIDDTNSKLAEMQGLLQDAKDRLAELNAELLEAQGQDEKAELLRQQLDYQQQLAEIEVQRAAAETAGNRELVAIYDQQIAKLAEINRLKLENIKADAQSAKSGGGNTSDRTTVTPTSGTAGRVASGGGVSNVFNINVDGKDLLSEEQVRNKIVPILNRTFRLSS